MRKDAVWGATKESGTGHSRCETVCGKRIRNDTARIYGKDAVTFGGRDLCRRASGRAALPLEPPLAPPPQSAVLRDRRFEAISLAFYENQSSPTKNQSSPSHFRESNEATFFNRRRSERAPRRPRAAPVRSRLRPREIRDFPTRGLFSRKAWCSRERACTFHAGRVCVTPAPHSARERLRPSASGALLAVFWKAQYISRYFNIRGFDSDDRSFVSDKPHTTRTSSIEPQKSQVL